MSDNTINPISNNVPVAAMASVVIKAQAKASVEESSNKEHSPKQAEVESEQIGNHSNISVNFRVNDNDEVVAFIVDRSSHKVLRSIPISEFYKLPAGELLKLAA